MTFSISSAKSLLSALAITLGFALCGAKVSRAAEPPDTAQTASVPMLDQEPPPPSAAPLATPDLPAAALQSNILTLPVSTTASGSVQTNTLTSPKIIQWLLANNASLTPLGSAGGLQGWLVTENGKQQVIYVTPDGEHLVAGIMADVGGEDVTALQMTALVLGKPPTITKDNPTGEAPPAPSPPPASASGNGFQAVMTVPQAQTNARQAIPQTGLNASLMASRGAPAVTAASHPPSDGSNVMASLVEAQPNSEHLSITPETLGEDISNTAVFTVGALGKPDLIMLADPNCPYCHASWTLLAPLVDEGKIDVSVVMVDVLNGSKTKALDLLANPNIGNAWQSGQGSQEGVTVQVSSDPAAMMAASKYLAANDSFAHQVDLKGTPTLLWVSKTGASAPYNVFKGTGLAGVGGFLTSLEHDQVATLN